MMRKQKSSKFLTTPTRPIQIDRDRSVAGILTKLEGAGFQGRALADAHNLWLQMLSDNSTVFMGLSGALIAGGMRRLISYLIKNHYVDVVVSTGANLFHDLHETLGRYHFQTRTSSPTPNCRTRRSAASTTYSPASTSTARPTSGSGILPIRSTIRARIRRASSCTCSGASLPRLRPKTAY